LRIGPEAGVCVTAACDISAPDSFPGP
jgi:hypothetical protein